MILFKSILVKDRKVIFLSSWLRALV